MGSFLRQTGLRAAFALLVGAAFSPVHAADALNGKNLYLNGGIGPGLQSCASCHGATPTTMGIQQGADPTFLTTVFQSIDPMKSIYGAVITPSQIADLSAFIANPNVTAAPAASLSPASLTFSGTTVGQTSGALGATLSNTGSAALQISTIAVAGTNASDFSLVGGSCANGASVAAGASCTLAVSFTPGAVGARTGAVNIAHNAAGGSSTLSLAGMGNAVPQATIAESATSVNFGSVATGTQAPVQTVTISNSGQATLTFSGIALSGTNSAVFTLGGSCAVATPLAAGASCTVTVTAAPTTTGALSANIAIASNASNGAATISLAATGAAPAPAITATPTSVAFGTQTIGGTAATQNVTLANTGNITLNLSAIKVTGTTAIVIGSGGSCGATLAVGASCNVPLTFTPANTSSVTAILAVTSNAAALNVTVTGTGTAAVVAQPTLTDKTIAFADTQIGSTSAAHVTTLSNPGTVALKLTALTITGSDAADFILGGTCAIGTSVAPSSNCTIQTSFKPAAAGARSASLMLITDSGAQFAVPLSGNGVAVTAAAPSLTVAPAAFDFGAVTIGSAAPTHSFTLSNDSTTAINVVGAVFTGPFSAVAGSGNCAAPPFTLTPGASCTLVVEYTAAVAGSDSGKVVLSTDAGASSTIALTGTASVATVTPASGATTTNEGGGGCSAARNGDDATLVILVLMALAVIGWRRGFARKP